MTDNQKAIYTALQTKKQELDQLLQANNITIKTLTAEQQATLASLETIMKMEDAPQDIEEPTFSDAVLQWKTNLKGELEKLKNKYKDVAIDCEKFATNISENASSVPINKALYEEWEAVVRNLQTEVKTGATVFDAIINSSEPTWVMASNSKKLADHYKKNKRKFYQKYDASAIEFKDKVLPQISLFEAALDASTDKKDKNHPDNIEKQRKAEEAEEEQAETLKGEYLTFVDNYTRTFARDVNLVKLGNPEALPDTVIIDVKKLFEKLNAAVIQDKNAGNTPVSKDFYKYMESKLKTRSYHTLEEVKSVTNTWIRDASAASSWSDAQFEVWKEKKTGFPNTALVAESINDAYVNINVDTIVANLTKWTGGVKDAFVLPKNYTISKEKAKGNFTELFDESSNSGISTLFIYKDIMDKYLNQMGGTAKVEHLKNEVWEKTTLNVIKEEMIAKLFQDKWLPEKGPYAIKSFNNELDSILPSTAEIQQALLKSIHRVKGERLDMEEAPANDGLQPLIFLRDTIGHQTVSKRLLIKLKYENYPIVKDGKVEDVICAVPTSVKLLADSSEPSKLSVQLVDSVIKRTKSYKTGGSYTVIRLKFMAVKDVEKLFNSIDTEALKIKGFDIMHTLKKFSVSLSAEMGKKTVSKNGGVKASASTGSFSISDFIYESTNVDYFDVEVKIQSVVEVTKGSSKGIKLNAFINADGEPNWTAKFEKDVEMLSTRYNPKYNYK